GARGAFRAFKEADTTQIDIEWVLWATNERLLLAVSVEQEEAHKISTDSHLPQHSTRPKARRIIAIDPDGTHATVLFQSAGSLMRRSLDRARGTSLHGGERNTILMPAWNYDTFNLFRVNVLTGVATMIERGHNNTIAWEVEEGHAALRYDTNFRGNVV